MAMTFEELKTKTVQQLREIAQQTGHEAVQGASQMNKEHLLPALCLALGIDAHEHHAASGINKTSIKAEIRKLKRRRDEALDAHDALALSAIRRQLHHLNHRIRAHTH
jgi:uncharacterized protein YpiB (UPF0302 family)